MGKLQDNQSGFGAVGVMLVIIVLALVGVVGWMVYKNHPKAVSRSTTTLSKTSSPTLVTKTDSTTTVKPTGSITGDMSYPADGLPDHFKLCAALVSDQTATPQCFDKPLVGGSDILAYKVDVAPGDYYVYEQLATAKGSYTPAYLAYYDQYSTTCSGTTECQFITQPRPLQVTVTANQTSSGISNFDWYDLPPR